MWGCIFLGLEGMVVVMMRDGRNQVVRGGRILNRESGMVGVCCGVNELLRLSICAKLVVGR